MSSAMSPEGRRYGECYHFPVDTGDISRETSGTPTRFGGFCHRKGVLTVGLTLDSIRLIPSIEWSARVLRVHFLSLEFRSFDAPNSFPTQQRSQQLRSEGSPCFPERGECRR